MTTLGIKDIMNIISAPSAVFCLWTERKLSKKAKKAVGYKAVTL